MEHTSPISSRSITTRRGLAGACLGAALLGTLSGCEVDSYFDPSVVGRWEHTPTVVPILDRIATIEPEDELVEVSEITEADLLPEVTSYRVGVGDVLDVIIFDYPSRGVQAPFQRRIDENGMLELPGIGRFAVGGLTPDQVQQTIAQKMKDDQIILGDPLISVEASGRNQSLYHVIGAIAAPGPYLVGRPDFKLLEALATAGGFSELTTEIYVIRQTALTPEASGTDNLLAPIPGGNEPEPGDNGESLIDIIDDLTAPEGGSPGVLSQPLADEGDPVIPIDDDGTSGQPTSPLDQGPGPRWVFIDGEWVQVAQQPNAGGGLPEVGSGLPAGGSAPIVTQRVIRVPVDRLIQGDARVNIVVRPGDIIRVPPSGGGNVYVGGFVNRPGVYSVAPSLTLTRLMDSAGGLAGLAIPERVDLIRMVGPDRQAMVRLNLRAIAEGTQPDIFIKANDRVNVGTNFWAFPLAVVRGGFRASYGFGFLLDRNFGNDVFGAPPSSRITR